MAKFKPRTDIRPGIPDFTFFCPGCKCDHGVWTTDHNPHTSARWGFNGDLNRPTVTPSILVQWNNGPQQKKNVCHSFINNGMIQYLGDCTHEYANKTIELPEVE